MTRAEFAALRQACGLSQDDLALEFGLSPGAVQEIETGADDEDVNTVHALALERVSLQCAVCRENPTMAAASVRSDALDLAWMIRG
ncbi:helix-turn-helix domain-containing protein [Bosea sp. BIWAKO-01]|uniref:helix-turn-helix domain-containing protein n=1 Tax=Bosea sp. BIWAKO-01 TaxID=506668 RepID=UPI000853573B|nr:helix-turn-helix transcriptional regulator [Bosea sp. BIWAKO-01]GAU85999.1 hypothetical protein BIWAKO_05947 [Bosea sp. BIWAKO-01]